jgi:DNA primase
MRAAEKAGVSQAAFEAEVERIRKKNASNARKQENRAAMAPLRNVQPQSRELRYTNVRSAVAERGVINLLYRFPEQFGNISLSGEDFSSEPLGRIYEALQKRVKEGTGLSLAVLGEQFSQDELALLAEIVHRDEVAPAAARDAMKDYIYKIRSEKDKASCQTDLLAYAEKLKQTKGYGGKDGS